MIIQLQRNRNRVLTMSASATQIKDCTNETKDGIYTKPQDSPVYIGVPKLAELNVIPQVVLGWRKYAGIICTLLASLLYTASNLLNKILTNRGYHPLTTAVWRFQGLSICAPLAILYLWRFKKQNVLRDMWEAENRCKTLFFLFLRSTIGFLNLVLYVYSLKYLKFADSTVISSSTPIAVILFSRLCLGEACGIVPIIAAIVAFGGVAILTRPPLLTGDDSFNEQTLIGTSLAFGSMVSLSSLFVVLRYLRKEHVTITLLFFAIIASVEGLTAALALGTFEVPRNQYDWWITIANMVMGVLGQICLVLSLKYEEAGPVALIRTLDILLAYIFQLIVLQIYPDILSIVGALVITVGIMCSAVRKMLASLPSGHPVKIRYKFFLK